LMRLENAELNQAKRKQYFDKVQEIVWEQAPFLYLVNKNALVAVAPGVLNTSPAVLRPQTVWNVEKLALTGEVAKRR
jgi:ABC-type transport system substrate-binding protein